MAKKKEVKNEKLSESMKGNKNSVGNKGGAPTKYNDDMPNKILEFFNREPFEYMMGEDDEGKKIAVVDKYGRPVKVACRLPTFEMFALSIDVVVQTLHNWCSAYPEFLEAYKKAEHYQKEILVQNGLLGGYEKTYAIFISKNVTDLRDRQEIKMDVNPVSQLMDEILSDESE